MRADHLWGRLNKPNKGPIRLQGGLIDISCSAMTIHDAALSIDVMKSRGLRSGVEIETALPLAHADETEETASSGCPVEYKLQRCPFGRSKSNRPYKQVDLISWFKSNKRTNQNWTLNADDIITLDPISGRQCSWE